MSVKENVNCVEVIVSGEEVSHSTLEKRALRKIDVRLLPILGCLYTLCLVDRSNVAAARISGMDDDLGLAVGNRASVTLMVFFIGYILFDIPSNVFIRKLGPANWLAFLAFSWGIVTLGIGFLQTWQGFAVLRSLLGILEAGFFPGQYMSQDSEVRSLMLL
jgi:MFS family permease